MDADSLIVAMKCAKQYAVMHDDCPEHEGFYWQQVCEGDNAPQDGPFDTRHECIESAQSVLGRFAVSVNVAGN